MNRGTALHRLGRHRDAIASYDWALAIQPGHAKARSNKIFVLDYLPDVDFIAHQRARHDYFLVQAKGFPALVPPMVGNRDPNRPLVLGYVSADFKRHSAASCFGPVLRRHDRQAFKLICYSGTAVEDDWTTGFRDLADVWRPTSGLSDETMAALIRADGVDILIDLSGHSEGNRLLTFARKPAPIQITAWGHGGGTGLPMVDYQFTDPVSTPPETRTWFAEASYDLPCCITFEAPAYAPEVMDLPAHTLGRVTFGSLNRFTKAGPAVLAQWARILKEVPQSRLLLKDGVFDDPTVQARVRATFAGFGLAPERILFRGFTSHRDHLAAYNEVDIVLDTYPQNGGTTTWEALWMGAGVITMLGNKPPSRLSGAILHALDLDAWIAENEADYLERAVRLAIDLEALARFRQGIRARMMASPAGNPELYTRAVEEAYRTMWRRWLEQVPHEKMGKFPV
jgi:predicted O-linked N-acetylglucosamine transferase (SPINDLY family)